MKFPLTTAPHARKVRVPSECLAGRKKAALELVHADKPRTPFTVPNPEAAPRVAFLRFGAGL